MSPTDQALADLRAWQGHLQSQREHEWRVVINSLTSAAETVHKLAQSEPYRSMAKKDFDRIVEAELAVSLTRKQLESVSASDQKKGEAA